MAVILIADDSPVQLLTCRHILSRGGFEVVTVTDGRHAWDTLQEMPVDMLISDVLMPGMDGFELLTAVRDSDDLRQLPVVLITGMAEEEQVLLEQAVGASAVLSKPVSSWALLDTVQQLLVEA